VADRIAGADEGVVGQRPLLVHILVVDARGPADVIAGVLPRHGAHVAVLAGDAFFRGRGGAVFFPDGFELDARVDLHLVAGDAELRSRDDVGLDGRLMHPDPLRAVGFVGPVGLIGTDQDLVTPGVADRLDAARRIEGAEDRLVDRAWRNAPRGVGLAVNLAGAMAGHAGDAFLRGRSAVPPGDVAPFAQGRADAGVTTHAEGIDGAGGQVVDLLFELVEHRRDAGIGVGGVTPLFVLIGVTLPTHFGRRILRIGQFPGVWIVLGQRLRKRLSQCEPRHCGQDDDENGYTSGVPHKGHSSSSTTGRGQQLPALHGSWRAEPIADLVITLLVIVSRILS
jgi:hypothetical protein